MRRCAGSFEGEDDAHETNASHASAHDVLLPADGFSDRSIGRVLRAPAVRGRGFSASATAPFRSGRVVVNEQALQLANQLTASGVPLDIATEVRSRYIAYSWPLGTSQHCCLVDDGLWWRK
jgi:hypothetical protein